MLDKKVAIVTGGAHGLGKAYCLKMAQETVKAFGRIDVLVNNAGFYHGMTRGSFDQISLAEWDKMFDVSGQTLLINGARRVN